MHNSDGNICTVKAKREIKVTFYSDDLKEVQSTAWSPVAVHVELEKLCLNGLLEVKGLKLGFRGWCYNVDEFSSQQLGPKAAVFQDS